MLKIIFENNDLFICIKPAGVSSQDSDENSVPAMLRTLAGTNYIGTVHRLDTAASGVMVYAKNKYTAAEISKQIQNGLFIKEYYAVVSGTPEKPEGILEDLLFKDSSKNKSYVVKRERKGVKKAVLQYSVIATNEINGDIFSLLKIKLVTGRTHQIRVQFASRKMPLVGDKKYGSKFACPLALFSHRLSFTDNSGNRTEYSSTPCCDKFPWNEFNDFLK